MKILRTILPLLCCIVLSQSAAAQLTSIHLGTNGNKTRFGVVVEGLGEVIIDSYGNVLRTITRDRHSFSDDYIEYEYYSDFNRYEAGKIKKIGAVTFTYYSSFNDYEAGKVKTIAGKSIKYYSNFNDYEAGKIKSVAGVNINYYSNFNDYEAGKIKSIGKYRYEYFSDFGGNPRAGQPKSGYARVKIDGLNLVVNNWIIRD